MKDILYFVEEGDNAYLRNKKGDYLYDVTGIPQDTVRTLLNTNSYKNWAKYSLLREPPRTRGLSAGPVYVKGSWFKVGDNIVDVLMKHPKRTYQESLFMLRQEGLYLDEQGIVREIGGKDD